MPKLRHRNYIPGFSERLRQALRDERITVGDLAERIGAGKQTVYGWTNGDSMPNAFMLMRVCAALHVSADYLLFGERI